MDYTCVKALTLGGVSYRAGDSIPAEAVLRSRQRALLRQGYIALTHLTTQQEASSEAPSAPESVQLPPPLLSIPLKGKEGTFELTPTAGEVVEAITIMQLNADEAAKAIESVASKNTLILVDVLDARKAVRAAVTARVEAMAQADDGGSDAQ